MYQLEKLQKSDFEEVWTIMEDSFPVDERRTREGQRQVIEEEAYRLYGYRKEGKIAAFFAVWEFESFVFIEHFAVAKEERNGGIGGTLLMQLIKQLEKKVVLEVELPNADIAKRRVAFYERNGFLMNQYDYIQPPMSEEGKAIPLRIMSTPKDLTKQEFEVVRDTLYRRVYKSI